MRISSHLGAVGEKKAVATRSFRRRDAAIRTVVRKLVMEGPHFTVGHREHWFAPDPIVLVTRAGRAWKKLLPLAGYCIKRHNP